MKSFTPSARPARSSFTAWRSWSRRSSMLWKSDGFAETVGDIGELSLELSEGLSCVIRAFWVYCLLGDGTRNEDGNAPVLLVFVFT